MSGRRLIVKTPHTQTALLAYHQDYPTGGEQLILRHRLRGVEHREREEVFRLRTKKTFMKEILRFRSLLQKLRIRLGHDKDEKENHVEVIAVPVLPAQASNMVVGSE